MNYSIHERVAMMVRPLEELCSRMQTKLSEGDGNISQPGPFILHRNQWACLTKMYSKVVHDITKELKTILEPLNQLERVMEATEKSFQECVAPHVRGYFNSTGRYYISRGPRRGDANEQRRTDLRLWMAKDALRHILDRQVPHHHFDNLRTASMAVHLALRHGHPNTLNQTLRHVHPDTLISGGSDGISIGDFSPVIYAMDKEQARAFFSHGEMAKIDISQLLLHRLQDNTGAENLKVAGVQFQKCGKNLGEGASGKVELRTWISDTLHVAVKMTNTRTRELQIQAKVRHPNLLPLLCWTQESEDSRLVMERMDKSLDELIHEVSQNASGSSAGQPSPPFTTRVSVEIMLQIAKGMEYLHSEKIMHRDLKPANVLVSGYDSTWTSDDPQQCLLLAHLRVKVADFGTSKENIRTSDPSKSYKVGTGIYRAPEVMDAVSNAGYSREADVYSFAMVCYHILSGKEPLYGDGRRRQIRKEKLRPEFDFKCEDALKEMVEACWHHDASKRPDFDQIVNFLRVMKICILRGMTHFGEHLFQRFHDSGIEHEARKRKKRSYSPSDNPFLDN